MSIFVSRRRMLVGLAAFSAMPSMPVASLAEEAAVFPDPSRIASIGGSLTEIIFALGEETKLVARDSTSTYPPAALRLPDVGYMRQLSPEGVLSVHPSGILALQGSGPREAIEVLKKASVPYVEIPDDFTHAGIVAKVRLVGRALGVEDKAERLAAQVDAELDAAQRLTANVGERKRVLFILSMQGGKILASGSRSAADGVISLAGAVNAIAGYEGYKQLTDEAAITARPDVILMMTRAGSGTHGDFDAELFAHPAIAATPAGVQKRLIKMDGAYLLGFGPRTAGAVKDLAHALYGAGAGN